MTTTIRVERKIWHPNGELRSHRVWTEELVRAERNGCIVTGTGYLAVGDASGAWGRMVTTWSEVEEPCGPPATATI